MPEATLDLADLSLWDGGFPDDVFADLRRAHRCITRRAPRPSMSESAASSGCARNTPR